MNAFLLVVGLNFKISVILKRTGTRIELLGKTEIVFEPFSQKPENNINRI